MSRQKTKTQDRAAAAAAAWRRELPDLPDLTPLEVIGRITEAMLVIDRERLTPVVTAFGLQAGEFDVLAALRRSGGACTLTPTELFRTTLTSSGGMTARIDRLEKAGLVRRVASKEDRRSTLIALTPKGRELIEKALRAHVANEADVMSCLTVTEQQMLNRLLAKLIAGQVKGSIGE